MLYNSQICKSILNSFLTVVDLLKSTKNNVYKEKNLEKLGSWYFLGIFMAFTFLNLIFSTIQNPALSYKLMIWGCLGIFLQTKSSNN